MKVSDQGHRYYLSQLDGDGSQVLQFVKREGLKYPGNVGHYEGTTSQEVLRALIDRAQYVNRQTPCWQTKLSLYFLHAVVWLYEQRAAKRHGRRAPGLEDAVYGDTCGKCGHVGCEDLSH